MINFGGQEVKGQGDRSLKVDLEAWGISVDTLDRIGFLV